ncbi:membrane protein [Gallibacterium genomosp. 2]|uniref:Membrane protein n=2 Tax=Gallibacterium TaxID=155493 RepID=A0A0A2XFC3_9PAST|nr:MULTISPECIES: porin [Gallibacterium]KGQ29677.1 membrane protein [Gallibacterium genomosp. 2]KGQ43348.1 membrane protein [Gallibacterium anatis]KGQ48275.1 membrane protein [Gallibacterium anatis]KGQ56748.1 membrane protein [Gallibacterium anatis]MDK9561734.1 porin [Gallibacterium anatis]
MKKTLVALAVAAVAATSANAAVVYNQDGTKVDVGGQVRLILSKDKNERADLKYGSSRIHAKVNQDLGDGYSALGHLEIGLKGDQDNVTVRRVYAGFAKEGIGQLTFGRQLSNLDDSGLSDFTYDLGGINLTMTEGNKVARFRSAEFAGLELGLDYFFGENDKNEYNHGAGFGTSLFYTAEVANNTTLQVNAGFSQVKVKKGSFDLSEYNLASVDYEAHKLNAFIVGAKLTTGPFAFAVDYSQQKASNNQVGIGFKLPHDDGLIAFPINKLQQLEVGAKYSYLENASVYGEYIYRKATISSDDPKVKVNEFILGTDYKFAKNVITYFEAGTAKAKFDGESARDHKLRVGLRVLF